MSNSSFPQPRPLSRAIRVILIAAAFGNPGVHAQSVVIELGNLDGSDGFRLEGQAEGDSLGYSSASVGDINGDGMDDLIVGAFGADPNGSYSGSSYVLFGSSEPFPALLTPADLNGSNGFRLDGSAAMDFSGLSVAGAGDVNGDAIDDLIIGAPNADPNGSSSGSSYVVFGRSTGFDAVLALSSLNGSNGFRLDGASAGDQAGSAVNSAGDVNGDGFGDLIIGAPEADPNGNYSGSSYVVFGRGSGFPATLVLSPLDGLDGFRLDGANASDNAGEAVSSAGDVNGDGFDDVLVGAFGSDQSGNNAGSSYVVFGQSTAFPASIALADLDGSIGFRIDGMAANDLSGRSVGAAGDVNADGLDDLIIGAPGNDSSGSSAGSSHVVFGRTTPFPASLLLADLDGTNGFRIDGAAELDASGGSVSRAGDVDGDGTDDLIIGSRNAGPTADYAGSAHVVFGRSTGLPPVLALATLDGMDGFRLDGAAEEDYAGGSVGSAGDINGDGFDDVIVGAYGTDANGSYTGTAYVVYGRDRDSDRLFGDGFE